MPISENLTPRKYPAIRYYQYERESILLPILYSVRAVCGLYYYVYKDNSYTVGFTVCTYYYTKGHVLHKQLLHYSIGSRILSYNTLDITNTSALATSSAIFRVISPLNWPLVKYFNIMTY